MNQIPNYEKAILRGCEISAENLTDWLTDERRIAENTQSNCSEELIEYYDGLKEAFWNIETHIDKNPKQFTVGSMLKWLGTAFTEMYPERIPDSVFYEGAETAIDKTKEYLMIFKKD